MVWLRGDGFIPQQTLDSSAVSFGNVDNLLHQMQKSGLLEGEMFRMGWWNDGQNETGPSYVE